MSNYIKNIYFRWNIYNKIKTNKIVVHQKIAQLKDKYLASPSNSTLNFTTDIINIFNTFTVKEKNNVDQLKCVRWHKMSGREPTNLAKRDIYCLQAGIPFMFGALQMSTSQCEL